MALKIKIMDGRGSNRAASVGEDNLFQVAVNEGIPPVAGSPNRYRYFQQLVSSNGDGTGTTNMNVSGGPAEDAQQKFLLNAHPDYDIRIMVIVLIIADSAIVHSNFGNISELTNGIELHTNENGDITKIIDAAKTGGQVIAQTGFAHPYGDGATSFELTNWTGTEDAQTIIVPIHDVVPGGLRIGRGTLDHLMMIVKDDLTGLTDFTARVIGYRHYP